jgi:hypothetical protein
VRRRPNGDHARWRTREETILEEECEKERAEEVLRERGGIAHVRAKELRRSARSAHRRDRCRAARLFVPTTRMFAPRRASSIATKRPMPRDAPVNSTVLPFMRVGIH